MTKSSIKYEPFYTETFKEQMEGISNKLMKTVEKRIQDILLDPYHYRDFGKGPPYRGKKKVRLNKKDRLFFVVCEECRQLRHKLYNLCSDCDETPDNTVIFAFILFDHNY